jgi:D-glycerate 3-kinase
VGAAGTSNQSAWERELLAKHRLPPRYLDHARKWFNPLADALAEHQKSAKRPILVGINGCQGSGKTTLCDYLVGALGSRHGLPAVALSLDDFYHTRDQRERLGREVHPLFATRGVPGTHDITLLQQTLDLLLSQHRDEGGPIPRFDKARDERRVRSAWDEAPPRVAVVLLEGWCLGARPQSQEALEQPVNDLERLEDPEGAWRRHVNRCLAREFEPLYRRIDRWVMMKAPGFDCVFRWRLEQEQKLAAATAGSHRIMDERAVRRFIQFFERLTRQCLEDLPARVDFLYTLDGERNVVDLRRSPGAGQ